MSARQVWDGGGDFVCGCYRRDTENNSSIIEKVKLLYALMGIRRYGRFFGHRSVAVHSGVCGN